MRETDRPTVPNASSERPGVQTSVFGVPDLVLDDVGLGGARFFRSFCQIKLRWHGFASPRALALRKLASLRGRALILRFRWCNLTTLLTHEENKTYQTLYLIRARKRRLGDIIFHLGPEIGA